MIIDDVTTGTLVGALRGTLARHRALTQNLANADTPGYQRVDVAFETSLARAVETDRARGVGMGGTAGDSALAAFTPATEATSSSAVRVDGSNVDADNELAQLSANQLTYQTVVGLLDKKFARIRTAITS